MAKKILKPCYGSIDLIGSIARSQYPETAAYKYADAMISTEKTSEPHFPEGAQAAHAALDFFVATDESLSPKLRNKRMAWGLFTDQAMFAEVLQAMAESGHEILRDQANAFLDVGEDDREMRGIRSTLRTQCSRTYSEPALMNTLCADSMDFSQMNNQPVTVYIVIPGALADVHFRYIKLLLTYFLSEIERGGLRRYEE